VLAKLAVLAVALGLVVHFGIVSPVAVAATLARPGTALAALALVFLGAQLNVLRWHLLLRWQGSPLRFGQSWQISYISYFLGSFLPGAAGSDALRALYLHRECPETRVAGFLTILFDRMLGLAALLLLALGLAACMPGEVMGNPVLAILVVVAAALLLALFATVLLASWLAPQLRRLPLPRVVRAVERLGGAAAMALAGWRGRPWRVVFCLCVGVLGHAFVAAAIVVLARAVGIRALSTEELALAGTLAVLANQVPLTPGGLGVGETSFAQICRLLAPGSAALGYGSVIFVFRLVTLLSFLPGAVALLTFRHSAGRAQAAAKAQSMADSTASTPASSSAG
jgi:uncharacterized protein (TIRG00374 family)